jgi:hypothetical protein
MRVSRGKRTNPDFALNTLTQVGLIKRQSIPNVVVQKWRNNGEKAFLVNPIIKEALSDRDKTRAPIAIDVFNHTGTGIRRSR